MNKTYFVRNKYSYLIMSPFDVIHFQNQFIFNCKFYIIYSRKIQSKDQLVVVESRMPPISSIGQLFQKLICLTIIIAWICETWYSLHILNIDWAYLSKKMQFINKCVTIFPIPVDRFVSLNLSITNQYKSCW